jgi:hypothetical protein
MHERFPDGRLQIELDTEQLIFQCGHSQLAGLNVLRKAGMVEELVNEARAQAQRNLIQMFDRKQLGDYVVVHPEEGKIINYQSEI